MITPLLELIRSKPTEINAWFDAQWKGLTPPLYLSCDIRHSGFKIGIVDTNLFPAGFNNLCTAYSRDTAKAFDAYFTQYQPGCKKILIYAEEHTRNKFYLKNVHHLKKLLESSGREVRVGVLGDYIPGESFTFELEPETLTVYRVERSGNDVTIGGFKPDCIVSNNDFSSGIPVILQNVSQPVIPSPHWGWHRRRKKSHFDWLKNLSEEFAAAFGIDAWLFYPYTDMVGGVDFDDEESLKRLAAKVEELLARVQQKYAEHGIAEAPYAYLKNNSGTYGLGILPVFSGEEVLTLNRRKKNKLLASKGGQVITEYLIQEGIPTADSYSGYPVEPVIYAVGAKDIGGFFRIHESKNELESLNAPGMTFSCLCLHKLNEPHEAMFLDCKSTEEVVSLSRFLARLASLALAKELENS